MPDFYRPDSHAFETVAAWLRDQILAGTLKPGDKLPSAASMARQLAVSEEVASNALLVLKREGITEAHRGRGTWVRARPIPEVRDVTALDPEVTEALALLGARGILADDVAERVSARIPTPEEAREMGTPEGLPVLVIVREFLAGGVVVHSDPPRLVAAERVELRYRLGRAPGAP